MQNKYFKNIIITALLTVVLLFGSCAYFISSAQRDTYSEKVMFLSELSLKDVNIIRTKIDDLLSKLQGISLIISKNGDIEMYECLKILAAEVESNEFKRMGVVLPNGRAYTTDGFSFDFSDREYFVKAMNGESNVSERLIDKADGQPINVFATPFYSKNEVIAVLFATKTTSSTAAMLSTDSFGGRGYSYIIRSDGTPVIYTLNPRGPKRFENMFDEISKNSENNEELAELKKGIASGENGTDVLWRDGIKTQISYQKIGIEDWYMISSVPTSVISAGTDALVNNIIYTTGLIFTSLFAIAWYVLNYFRSNNKRLASIAYTDDVTGYSNWNGFKALCEQILADEPYTSYAMIAFDIGKFKVINDIYGYELGNELLCHITNTLNVVLPEGTPFARISADNFSVLVEFTNRDLVRATIEKITASVEWHIPEYHIELPFGIYILDEGLDNISIINDRANLAKRAIKNRVDINYNFYDGAVRSKILREKEIENYMETALLQYEFEVYLQPKYDIITEKIVGAEALVRWNHPEQGIIQPGEFIPLFEKNGFVKRLDMYMFEHVCELIAHWDSLGINQDVAISVNLSRAHLNNPMLTSDLMSITEEYFVPPSRIEIELTESAVFEDSVKLIEIIQELKAMGFVISIDDFGSGYSSLNTLKDLPVDIIKLDRGFLQETTDDDKAKVIISTLIEMTKTLNMKTVAEGVETLEQLQFLRGASCDIAQGYYYARPMKVSAFEALLRDEAESETRIKLEEFEEVEETE